MVRRLREEEILLWARVAETVNPAPGVLMPKSVVAKPDPRSGPMILPVAVPQPTAARKPVSAPQDIEPNRKRKIMGEFPLEARIDLHGMTQDQAEAALAGFLRRAHDQGHRAALVITGRGVQGQGVLRRRAPEWLSRPDLRPIVAGFSEAHQKHGGEGAIYVALKRRRVS
jgi:DNA-nicking Smr family endonuclease